jgi:hypothetical protein
MGADAFLLRQQRRSAGDDGTDRQDVF